MNTWWGIAAALALSLSGCGGGGSGGDVDGSGTAFASLVSQARATGIEQTCEPASGYSSTVKSTLYVTKLHADEAGLQIELFDEESYFATTDCSGTPLAVSQLMKDQEPVPVLRVLFVSSLPSATVHWRGRDATIQPVDLVDTIVNPLDGRFEFQFAQGVEHSVQRIGLGTTAEIVSVEGIWRMTHEVEESATSRRGMVRVGGEVMTLKQEADGSFSEVDD
jgi:hypothetical protein